MAKKKRNKIKYDDWEHLQIEDKIVLYLEGEEVHWFDFREFIEEALENDDELELVD